MLAGSIVSRWAEMSQVFLPVLSFIFVVILQHSVPSNRQGNVSFLQTESIQFHFLYEILIK